MSLDSLYAGSSPEYYPVTAAWDATNNAIKTSIATVAAAVTYSGAGLNGAIGAGAIAPSALITVKTSASGGAYIITSPIVITGTNYLSDTITDNITLTLTGGNETVATKQPFSSVTSIAIPAMANTAGAFLFGLGNLAFVPYARALEMGATGGVVKLVAPSGKAVSLTLGANTYRPLAIGQVDTNTAVFPFIIYR